MKESELLYLLNNLDDNGLLFLPGIGVTMVSRILAARPFRSLKELENVSGITHGVIRKMLKADRALYNDFLS